MRDILNDKVRDLATSIREWSRSQLELWQQVPNLSLEANGRHGFSASLTRCYHFGVWSLDSNSHDKTIQLLGVDCATGDIVHDDFSGGTSRVGDESIVGIVGNFDLIDAQKIVDRLTLDPNDSRPSYYSEQQWAEHEEKRVAMRLQYGLGFNIPYVRKTPVTAG